MECTQNGMLLALGTSNSRANTHHLCIILVDVNQTATHLEDGSNVTVMQEAWRHWHIWMKVAHWLNGHEKLKQSSCRAILRQLLLRSCSTFAFGLELSEILPGAPVCYMTIWLINGSWVSGKSSTSTTLCEVLPLAVRQWLCFELYGAPTPYRGGVGRWLKVAYPGRCAGPRGAYHMGISTV
jgi:hypothetical protein